MPTNWRISMDRITDTTEPEESESKIVDVCY